MKQLPSEPGDYFWSEWNKIVTVYQRGQSLWVRVFNHWQPVKITQRIAGTFTKVES